MLSNIVTSAKVAISAAALIAVFTIMTLFNPMCVQDVSMSLTVGVGSTIIFAGLSLILAIACKGAVRRFVTEITTFSSGFFCYFV